MESPVRLMWCHRDLDLRPSTYDRGSLNNQIRMHRGVKAGRTCWKCSVLLSAASLTEATYRAGRWGLRSVNRSRDTRCSRCSFACLLSFSSREHYPNWFQLENKLLRALMLMSNPRHKTGVTTKEVCSPVFVCACIVLFRIVCRTKASIKPPSLLNTMWTFKLQDLWGGNRSGSEEPSMTRDEPNNRNSRVRLHRGRANTWYLATVSVLLTFYLFLHTHTQRWDHGDARGRIQTSILCSARLVCLVTVWTEEKSSHGSVSPSNMN